MVLPMTASPIMTFIVVLNCWIKSNEELALEITSISNLNQIPLHAFSKSRGGADYIVLLPLILSPIEFTLDFF